MVCQLHIERSCWHSATTWQQTGGPSTQGQDGAVFEHDETSEKDQEEKESKKYRPEEDYHEGYEDVYYYASEQLHSEYDLNVVRFSHICGMTSKWLV